MLPHFAIAAAFVVAASRCTCNLHYQISVFCTLVYLLLTNLFDHIFSRSTVFVVLAFFIAIHQEHIVVFRFGAEIFASSKNILTSYQRDELGK